MLIYQFPVLIYFHWKTIPIIKLYFLLCPLVHTVKRCLFQKLQLRLHKNPRLFSVFLASMEWIFDVKIVLCHEHYCKQ